MKINRAWITSLTAGAFLVSATTGILMFFHWDNGANKWLHEWLSWALLVGAGFHLVNNFQALKKYLRSKISAGIVGAFVVMLAVSFVPWGEGKRNQPLFMASINALASAPMSTLALVAKCSPDEMKARLAKAGVVVGDNQQSLSDVMGKNPKAQMYVLAKVLNPEEK